MPKTNRDPSVDAMLDLDGQVLVVDPRGGHCVKFVVRHVEPSRERPHGLTYSLTLHNAAGVRLVGFDNAHPVRESRRPGGKSRGPYDHKHRLGAVRPYRYRDAGTLLEDFWSEVDSFLKERGVL
jgi:hypothetical protein